VSGEVQMRGGWLAHWACLRGTLPFKWLKLPSSGHPGCSPTRQYMLLHAALQWEAVQVLAGRGALAPQATFVVGSLQEQLPLRLTVLYPSFIHLLARSPEAVRGSPWLQLLAPVLARSFQVRATGACPMPASFFPRDGPDCSYRGAAAAPRCPLHEVGAHHYLCYSTCATAPVLQKLRESATMFAQEDAFFADLLGRGTLLSQVRKSGALPGPASNGIRLPASS